MTTSNISNDVYMNLVNQTVVHKAFGEGTIVAYDGNYITVKFSAKESKFVAPDIFTTFLKCKDAKLQAELEVAFAAKEEAKVQKARKEHERALREAEEAKKRAEEAAKTSTKRTTTQPRKSNENNLAFKCNFCNGGCGSNCIGYKGVCSDDQIRYNIEVRRHSWCSNVKSPCRQYLDGAITRAELDALNVDKFVCYESRMLTAWTAAAGEDLDEKSGISQGRRMQDAASNSLAVLTTRYLKAEEEDRIIFGVFVTGEAIEGDEDNAGYVVAKEGYAIELTPDEAKQMMFWHYYKNSDGGIRWSQGLYRYLKDTACARILADIVGIKTNPSEKAHAQKVFEYYCKIKGIDIKNIPEANGAI